MSLEAKEIKLLDVPNWLTKIILYGDLFLRKQSDPRTVKEKYLLFVENNLLVGNKKEEIEKHITMIRKMKKITFYEIP